MENNYARFLEEFERKVASEAAAEAAAEAVNRRDFETALNFLDLGIPRDAILNGLGRDELWLREVEAERKPLRKKAG